MHMNTKHEFALYVPNISTILRTVQINSSFTLDDPALVARITTILRLRVGESFTIFDTTLHATCVLALVGKKNVTCTLVAKQLNNQLRPKITFILPVLKRDDLQEALYCLVELGANHIQLVLTQKIHRQLGDKKEFERLRRIMIAAAEQSKNFTIPSLCEPIALHTYLEKLSGNAQKIYFDVEGQQAMSVVQQIKVDAMQELYLMVGPEADLTPEEKALLRSHNFIFCMLTPTVLRAAQAVAVGLGIFRSMLR